MPRTGVTLALLLALLITPAVVRAQAQSAGDAHEPDPSPRVEKRLVQDLHAMGRAARQGRTWAHVAEGTAAVLAVSTADNSLRDAVQRNSTSGTRAFARDLRQLGETGGLALAGGAWAYGATHDHPQLALTGEDALEAAAIASAITSGVKLAAGRSRPIQRLGHGDFRPFSGHASFPSGESTEAFALAAVVSHHAPRAWMRSVAWGLASAVAVGRMELDAHWVSDVVAGGLIGGGLGHWLAQRHDPLVSGPVPAGVQSHALPMVLPIAAPSRHGSGVALRWSW